MNLRRKNYLMGPNEQVPSENDEGSSQPELEAPEANSRKRKRTRRVRKGPTFGMYHKEVMEFNKLWQPAGPKANSGKNNLMGPSEQVPCERDEGSSPPEVEAQEANSRKRTAKNRKRMAKRPTFGMYHKEVMEFNELGQPVGPEANNGKNNLMGPSEQVPNSERDEESSPPEVDAREASSRKRTAKRPTFGMHHKEVMQFNELGQPVEREANNGKNNLMGPSEQVPNSERDEGSSSPEVEAPEAVSRKRTAKRPTFGMYHKEVMQFNELGQPVGPRATVTKFGRYLGMLSRDTSLFPVNTKDWRSFKNSSNIEKAWERVKEKLDWSDPEMVKKEKDIKNVVIEKLDDRWRHWKASLRRHHYLPLQGMEDRWKCGDNSVDESQWKDLVDMWEGIKGKNRSETNKRNRKNLKTSHTTGRITFAQVRYDYKLRMGHEPDRVTFFKMTHTRKDGKAVDEASKEILDDFEKREKEIRERGEVITADVRNGLFASVMGPEKRGRVRGFGIGVSWDQVPGIIIEQKSMSKEMRALREELEQQRENALNAQEEMERMKSEALEREQRIRDEAAAREERLRHEQEELAAKMKQMDADIERRVTDKIGEMMRLMGFGPAMFGGLLQASMSAGHSTK